MIFVLTGAGISRESGLETFRDKDGLWSKVRIEDVATPAAFKKNPKLVHEFYNKRRRELTDGHIKPNKAHKALARLEAALDLTQPEDSVRQGPGLFLVTQNVDNLHELGGSKRVCHTHGSLTSAKCEACGASFEWLRDLGLDDVCPRCQAPGRLRPDVVWFHEVPYHLGLIEEELYSCDLFVSIGTSGVVYPAASYINVAKRRGVPTVEINLEPTVSSSYFDKGFYGPATEAVPAWVESILPLIGT
ncbi:MAG: NAD-dependent deacylase [Deltaproteobacteria bacterium]|nr:NAD-dependent deacylase [Deltaproteobacteria bacterium]